jgi:hypothetical protein
MDTITMVKMKYHGIPRKALLAESDSRVVATGGDWLICFFFFLELFPMNAYTAPLSEFSPDAVIHEMILIHGRDILMGSIRTTSAQDSPATPGSCLFFCN